jgi:hypothetical protein
MTLPNRTALNAQITSHKNLSYYGFLSEDQLENLKKQVLREMVGLDESQMQEILNNLDKGVGFRHKLVQG